MVKEAQKRNKGENVPFSKQTSSCSDIWIVLPFDQLRHIGVALKIK